MKWILLVQVWAAPFSGLPPQHEYIVRGWSSEATCQEAQLAMLKRYNTPSLTPFVLSYCLGEGEAQIELPRPR